MSGHVRRYDELLHEYTQERSDPEWQPVRLGFGTLDAELRGISPGQVCTIAARTAVGKTWLLETIEHNFASRDDAGTLSLSLEMPGAEWAERAVAISEGVSPETLRDGRATVNCSVTRTGSSHGCGTPALLSLSAAASSSR